MSLDIQTKGSPGWWLARLDQRLWMRRRRYDRLYRYYMGEADLPEGDERCREMFKRFQQKARTNMCRLVANAVNERLEVVGFRAGGSSTPGNDMDAWKVWQANHLDADQSLVHLNALIMSDAYVIVGPPDDDDDGDETGFPVITAEDARQVVAEMDPINRRKVRAALKTWYDDVDGLRHAVLYLPSTIHYFSAPQEMSIDLYRHDMLKPYAPPHMAYDAWQEESEAVENPLDPVVPVVRFVVDPMLGGDGLGEFEDVIDIQDRINDTILNRLVIQKVQAYRQRWVSGIETEDENGNDLDLPFVPGVDLLWAVDDPDVKFGEFAVTDLGPILEAIKSDVTHLVMLTGLPPHYVAGDLVNASADALAAAEARLTSKCGRRSGQFGEAWEQVLRLAYQYMGQPEALGVDAEVQWRDPERKTVAQLADSAVKKQAAGVPWRQRMEDLGYSPSQIERMAAERAADVLLAHSLAAAASTAQPGAQTGVPGTQGSAPPRPSTLSYPPNEEIEVDEATRSGTA